MGTSHQRDLRMDPIINRLERWIGLDIPDALREDLQEAVQVLSSRGGKSEVTRVTIRELILTTIRNQGPQTNRAMSQILHTYGYSSTSAGGALSAMVNYTGELERIDGYYHLRKRVDDNGG